MFRKLKIIVCLTVVLFSFFLFHSVQALTLGINGNKFTIDGSAKFLTFVSYFDALRASNGTLDSDFAYLKSKGIDGVRIFPNWWGAYNKNNPPHDTLMNPADGTLRSTQLAKLKTVVEKANSKGLVVDVSFAKEIEQLSLANYKKAIVSTVQALSSYKNIFYDIQNEYNCNNLTAGDVLDIRNAVKGASNSALVSASIACGAGPAEAVSIATSANLDIINYHDDRSANWYSQTGARVNSISPSSKPIYFGEPEKWSSGSSLTADNFTTAVTRAKSAGAAAWTFHTRAAYNLGSNNMQNFLDAGVEKSFLDTFGPKLAIVAWGSETGGASGGGEVVPPPLPPGSSAVDLKNVTPTTPTSVWNASSANGWWPNLSPDGKYVAYGNWGDSFVTDLQTKQTWNFKNPADLTVAHRCLGGAWIKPDTLSFVCEFGTTLTFYRYEVKIGEWIPKRTADDPSLVAGNFGAVGDGHWASFSVSGKRLAKDNQTINTGEFEGSLSISGDILATSCNDTDLPAAICIWEGSSLSQTIDTQTSVFALDTDNGYILYSGYDESIYGINPDGQEINLTATSPQKEGTPIIVSVNSKPWVATTTCINNTTGNCYGLVRPWGERKSIVTSAKAPYGLASIVYANNNFVMAFQGDKGQLVVQTIPANSTRVDLCGDACTDTGDTSSGSGAPAAPFPPSTTLPVPSEGLPTDLGQLIEAIFTWSLRLIGLVIFVRFFYAGFLWFTAAGNSSNVANAKKIMKNAVYGALVLFSAWLILNTINPDLVGGKFDLPGLPAGQSTTGTTP